MDSVSLEAHLLQLCNAVGGYEVDVETQQESYVLGDEAIDCLKDIKQLLRLDDKTQEKDVQRLLGEWRFLQNDLVPIFTTFHQGSDDSKRLIECVLELMVPLTWPLEDTVIYHKELQQYQKNYVKSLATEKVLDVVLMLLLDALSKDKKDRNRHDEENISLLLFLLRNMVLIDSLLCSETDAVTADRGFYTVLRDKSILELLVTFAASMEDNWVKQWSVVILEIFYLVLCPFEPEDLAKSALGMDDHEGADGISGVSVQKKTNPIQKGTGGRNPRFKGVYSVVIGNENRYVVQGKSDPSEIMGNKSMAEPGKKNKTNPLTKRKITELSRLQFKPRSRLLSKSEKECLIMLSDMFIESSLNVLFGLLKNDVRMERLNIKDDDYTRFIMLCSYFLEYSRLKARVPFGSIACLLDTDMLGLILKKIHMSKEEKNLKHLQLSVKCLTKWILIVEEMVGSSDEDEQSLAQGLQGNLFYREEDLQTLVGLVKTPSSLDRCFLEDMVELIHNLLKFLERYFKSNQNMVVLKKTKKRKNSDGEDDQENAYERKECKFEFNRLQARLQYESTLETYFELLKHAKDLRKGTVHYIAKMFHRLFVKCDVDALMFKINYLYEFNVIMRQRRELNLKNPEFKDLVDFIRFFMNKFLAKAKKHPTLFIDVFFSKTKSEWREINGLFEDDRVETESKARHEEKAKAEIENAYDEDDVVLKKVEVQEQSDEESHEEPKMKRLSTDLKEKYIESNENTSNNFVNNARENVEA